MIGLDTNILVRYLTRDDPKAFERARILLEKRCDTSNPGWINLVVLTETVWVLTRAYGVERGDISRVVEQLLSTRQIRAESSDLVRKALAEYRSGNTGFADCLIGQINQQAGCEVTFTFDRKAAASTGFRLL